MITNTRNIHINLSFAGHQIGFLPGESKKLSHLLTPIQEFKMAKTFGLMYTPDQDMIKEVEKTIKQNQIKEEKLAITQTKILEPQREKKEALAKEAIKLIVEDELDRINSEDQLQLDTKEAVDVINLKFSEKDVKNIREEKKEQIQVLEENDIEKLESGKMIKYKDPTPTLNKKTNPKKPETKKPEVKKNKR